MVVPPEVVAELHDITQYLDIHAAAANTVLAARTYITVEGPYERDETPDSRPTFGLDNGETDRSVLASALADLTQFRVELRSREGPLQLCERCSPGGLATYWTRDLEAHVVEQ